MVTDSREAEPLSDGSGVCVYESQSIPSGGGEGVADVDEDVDSSPSDAGTARRVMSKTAGKRKRDEGRC